jgi:hypothetical protein
MVGVLHLTALPLLVAARVVGGKIMVLFIHPAHPLMRVGHITTTIHQLEQVLLDMEVAPVMMPATLGVLVEVAVRVDMDLAVLPEAPADLVLVTTLEPAAIKRTAKVEMVVVMQMERLPEPQPAATQEMVEMAEAIQLAEVL